jgi:PIN like domain
LRKQYGASSTDAERLSNAVFYLDESIYSRLLLGEMRAAGANVRHVGEPGIPFGSSDEHWLTVAGNSQWIALMRDQKIKRRELEKAALMAAGLAAFAFIGGEATAKDTADAIVPHLVKFANMAISEPRPFLYTFGFSGHLSRVKLKRP